MSRRYIKSMNDVALQPLCVDEIEMAVLGALLLEPNAINEIGTLLYPEYFYSEKNQTVYKVIQEMHKNNEAVDMLTVVEKLKSINALESIGGAYYIAQLTENVASASHIVNHALVIKEYYLRRRTVDVQAQITDKVRKREDIGEVLFQAGKEIGNLFEILVDNHSTSHISNALSKAVKSMYNRKNNAENGICSGIKTGLTELDNITNGWQKSELIVIAGRPGMGKTAIALHFALTASKQQKAIAMFSLEMSDISLANRLLLAESNVSPDNFKSGFLNKEETIEIEEALGKIWNYPIYIDDNPSVSMSYIRMKSRLLKKQNKCDMVIIDYLQLTSESKDKNRNREQEIAQMSREAKILAKELDVPVILLSQLNRNVETRTDKTPLLSDLRESGAIEQDADIVAFIHRPEYYGEEVEDKEGRIIKNYGVLIVAKNRNGRTGKAKFLHDGTLTKVYDYPISTRS